ncbi:lipid A biosynthesis acyltransferase [Methylotenera oryzisoli]|jgi:KDO2-lipid IV(A) lauroyltransferase|uniref:Lipid A biosynthesis acyltransferase n=1 Tax=Methylotenera oryzisoli TaxID=2080758 RepID=A0A4Y9VQ44_9PROT|nr:lipid A biosynthesis acyltransferase [Methylotenera oryzisoli]
MISTMFKFLLKPLTLLSLPTIHKLGTALGNILYLLMPQAKTVITENLTQSGLVPQGTELNALIKLNMAEAGKSLLESLALWQKDEQEVLSWVKPCTDWHLVEEARAKKKGIIFLTPHMGCFEITSVFYGAQHPITVLYRRPKLHWLHALTVTGRTRQQVKLAPANLQGVRNLIQALKRGEAIGILPDQVPGRGEGEWAPFFGKPAYTMTLVGKLAEKTGATVIMVFGERLSHGEGFQVHMTKLEDGAIATPALLNQAIEQQVSKNITQYLWQYPRYRVRNRVLKREQKKAEAEL